MTGKQSLTPAELKKFFPQIHPDVLAANTDKPPVPMPSPIKNALAGDSGEKKGVPEKYDWVHEGMGETKWRETPASSVISFYIPIEPRPVQSGKRIGFNKKTGKKFIFTDKKTSQYYKEIEAIATPLAPENPLEGALSVTYEFFISRPKNLYRKADPDESIWCPQAKDTDNLIKGVQDALTNSGFWHSDAQIVILTAYKKYSAKGDKGGFNVTIKPVK